MEASQLVGWLCCNGRMLVSECKLWAWRTHSGARKCGQEPWSSTQGWRRTLLLSLCQVPRGQAGIRLSFVSEEPYKRTIIIHRTRQGKGVLNTLKLPGGGEPSGTPWISLLFWDSPVCLIGGDHPCTGWTLMLILHLRLIIYGFYSFSLFMDFIHGFLEHCILKALWGYFPSFWAKTLQMFSRVVSTLHCIFPS